VNAITDDKPMTDAERHASIHAMSQACLTCLSTADALLVAEVMMQHTARMTDMFNAEPDRAWTYREFAAFALRCAKRIRAGGPA
jgi:hypothetical protein